MPPMRGTVVKRSLPFISQLDQLLVDFPILERQIEELEDALRLDYDLNEFPIDAGLRVYAIRVDYPPHGSAGRGRFLVTYHATDPEPSMHQPYRTVTLLTIADRSRWDAD